MPTDPASEFAPAKINLCLHVTGRRDDGYHLLDSLVVFAGVGDRVSLGAGPSLDLQIDGPEARGLTAAADNLVLRAARLVGLQAGTLRLWKALPLASGIGGGSADAAATLRLISRQTGRPTDPAQAVGLGADVPVCLAGRPARMRGIGESLAPMPPLPPLWLVLVNLRIATPTPQVFAALTRRQNPPLPDLPTQGWANAADLADWLQRHSRNDLFPPALILVPGLAGVLDRLNHATGCLMARMSGSGATCFGLFADPDQASSAAARIATDQPGWWVAAAPVLA